MLNYVKLKFVVMVSSGPQETIAETWCVQGVGLSNKWSRVTCVEDTIRVCLLTLTSLGISYIYVILLPAFPLG